MDESDWVSFRLIYRLHALRRMVESGIGDREVRHAITAGEVVEQYEDDIPYPSRLVMAWHDGRPLHVVVAENLSDGELVVVSVYEPDPGRWDSTFRRRLG